MKTWTEYLAANGNDAEKAGQAAARDAATASDSLSTAQSELKTVKTSLSEAQTTLKDAQTQASSAKSDADALRGQNASARAFKRVYKPLAEALKLPTEDLSDEAKTAEQVTAALATYQNTNPRVEVLTNALKELGGNPDELEPSVQTLKARLAKADRADVLERGQAIRDAAETLGYDHAKLARLSGIDALTQQDVKTEKDGQTTSSKVWGVPSKDAEGKDTFTSLKDFAAPFDASLKGQQQGRQWTPAQVPSGQQAAPNPIAAALNPNAQPGQARVHNALDPNPATPIQAAK